MTWRSELPVINIINMTLKNKITTFNNLIETRKTTLNDPRFDIKITRHPVYVNSFVSNFIFNTSNA